MRPILIDHARLRVPVPLVAGAIAGQPSVDVPDLLRGQSLLPRVLITGLISDVLNDIAQIIVGSHLIHPAHLITSPKLLACRKRFYSNGISRQKPCPLCPAVPSVNRARLAEQLLGALEGVEQSVAHL